MKRIVSAIFILLLTTQAFSKWIIVLEFGINREYIAANLCENRAKPVFKCGGKCQLTKEMAEDQQDPAGRSQLQLKFQETAFSQLINITEMDKRSGHPIMHSSVYTVRNFSEPYFPIFHPPA